MALRRILVRSMIELANRDYVSWQVVNVIESEHDTAIEFEGVYPYALMTRSTAHGRQYQTVRRFVVTVADEREWTS